jgi:hypothetical protein
VKLALTLIDAIADKSAYIIQDQLSVVYKRQSAGCGIYEKLISEAA